MELYALELYVTEKAAALIRRKGGRAVIDLLEPHG